MFKLLSKIQNIGRLGFIAHLIAFLMLAAANPALAKGCGPSSGLTAKDLTMVEAKPDGTPKIDAGAFLENAMIGNKKALDALRRCGAQNDPDAMSLLGMYYSGKDDAQALNWFLKAEAGGQDVGCILGKMFDRGEGTTQNDDMAAKWYLKSAEKGDSSCKFNLGLLYFDGRGVPKDVSEAVKWWIKAADQGDASAQLNVGMSFENGDGVPQDKSQAVHYYNLACKSKSSDGCFAEGVLNYNGEGVSKNKDAGVALIRQALKLDPKNEKAKNVLKKLGLDP